MSKAMDILKSRVAVMLPGMNESGQWGQAKKISEALSAAGLEIAQKDKWNLIETARGDGKPFLMYVPAYEHPIVTGWGPNVDLRPTHWQPLPKPPEGQTK